MNSKWTEHVKLTRSDKELIKGMAGWASGRIKDERSDVISGWLTDHERKLRLCWHKATLGVLVNKVALARKAVRRKERMKRLWRVK